MSRYFYIIVNIFSVLQIGFLCWLYISVVGVNGMIEVLTETLRITSIDVSYQFSR